MTAAMGEKIFSFTSNLGIDEPGLFLYDGVLTRTASCLLDMIGGILKGSWSETFDLLAAKLKGALCLNHHTQAYRCRIA